MADNQSVAIATIQSQIAALTIQYQAAVVSGNNELATELRQQIINLSLQLQALQLQSTLPTASTGQVAQEDGTVNAEPITVGANGRVGTAATTAVTNSAYVGVDGTTGQTLTTTTSQATSNAGQTGPIISATTVNQNLTATVAAPKTSPGVGEERDDNTTPNTNATQQIINTSFNNAVIPQPNVLDNYVSYTYSLSWYLITPQQFAEFNQGSRNIASWSLLAQTGGANQVGRNQFFQNDYYMDNLVIESYTPGKATNLSHSAMKFEFTLTEPNGITLINNLHAAVATLYKQAGVTDTAAYLQAPYVLVIRFYGYDENGNLIYPVKGQGLVGYPNIPSNASVIEKYYPFNIQNLTFRLTNKQIEYRVIGQPLPYQTAISADRGSIPFQFELVGETVADILVGKPVGTVYPTTDQGARESSPQPQTTAPSPASSSATNILQNTDLGTGLNVSTSFIGA
jgi:hypothetical protein